MFTSSIDWTPNPRLSISTGYNYNWIDSDSVVNFFFNNINHPTGHSLGFVRNNFFFADVTAQLTPRLSLYTSYRINDDNGQGSRVADPIATPGTLIASYPMSFQSPEARLAYRINRHFDWNLGYSYYNYNESPIVGPRPQNYHAHLPHRCVSISVARNNAELFLQF